MLQGYRIVFLIQKALLDIHVPQSEGHDCV